MNGITMSRHRPKERPLREVVRDGWTWDGYTARQKDDAEVRAERNWETYLSTRPGSEEALAAIGDLVRTRDSGGAEKRCGGSSSGRRLRRPTDA